MDSRRLALPLALVALVVVATAFAFVFVSFHAMESATAADTSVGTSRANDARAPTDQPLHVVVVGEGPIVDRLADDLEASLSERWASVSMADEPIAAFDGPVYVVDLAEADVRYNPLSPSARLTAAFAFVGTGNGTKAARIARGDRPTVLTNETPYVVQGDVTIVDESRGIVSMPGYYDHVSARLATKLADSLASAPGM
jgi:hypothetical protein